MLYAGVDKLEYPWLQLDMNVFVAQKEVVSFEDLQLGCWCLRNLESGDQLGHCYLHLNDCKPLTDADPWTTAKRKVGEWNNLIAVGLQEPLWFEFFRLGEELGVVVHRSKRKLDNGVLLDLVWSKCAIFSTDTIQPVKKMDSF